MEAGQLSVEAPGPMQRLREMASDHPARAAGVVLGVLFLLMVASKGLEAVLDTGLTGLSTGSIYALGAVGLTLVYGILKLVNFAHGDFLTFGAYMAFVVNVSWGAPLILAVLFAMAMTAILGVALERVMWRPMRQRGAGMLQLLLMSIGLALVIRYGLQFFYGTELRSLDVNKTATVDFLGLSIGPHPSDRCASISFAVLLGTGLMLRYTLLGQADAGPLGFDRARGDVRHRHRPGDHVDLGVRGRVRGSRGRVPAAVTQIQPELGFELLLPIFAAVVLGGIGDAFGALAGGILLGLVVEWSRLYIASGLKMAVGVRRPDPRPDRAPPGDLRQGASDMRQR